MGQKVNKSVNSKVVLLLGVKKHSKLLFGLVTMKIEIFSILVSKFPNTLFIESCHKNVEIGLLGILKLFDGAEALSSHTCSQLSKKMKDTSVSLSNFLVNSRNHIFTSHRLVSLSTFMMKLGYL
ncbi:hypothetical protein AVEN_131423-1 [Araneus ventricosus]|uniref:Uncharacterized protein n=1 Tax=Araneus ventricosus TaxID=182803 RepID=A0A4Y2JBK3_ARAVE|nr:hypothetical protein AVEN_131423-1 [Araneus ventricosus]